MVLEARKEGGALQSLRNKDPCIQAVVCLEISCSKISQTYLSFSGSYQISGFKLGPYFSLAVSSNQNLVVLKWQGM